MGNLYLVRHGIAIPRGSFSPDDGRWLTEKGRRRFRKAARRFARRLSGGLDLILTSPLPRAVMTAEILARALRFDGPVEVRMALAPESDLAAALALLRGQQGDVAVVGHEPQLSQLLSGLCAPEAAVPGELEKGAIATLRRPKDPGGAFTLRRID